MSWYTTTDLDKFMTAAVAYLSSAASENIALLSAVADARDGKQGSGRGSLYGWWEPADGAAPRAAFLHDASRPLLIAGHAPEPAAALAAPLARAGRSPSGVDACTPAADAFADAWRQRTGTGARLHRTSHVHRLTGCVAAYEAPPGHARSATWADRDLLVSWLRSLGNEIGDLTAIPEASADDLLGYGGAAFWEAGDRPVATAMVAPAVAGAVQVSNLYAPPEHRGHGYAIAVLVAVCRAALVGRAREVVLVTDGVRPMRRVARLGFELLAERTALSFGPPTGPIPRVTGPLSRVTGPVPRLR
ncbi:MAG: GNAT family N-acetyltransferase [Actinomycetia bacterium]|nr:GNAT family N-acetyltransferase [Actinomycetes bacterium]